MKRYIKTFATFLIAILCMTIAAYSQNLNIVCNAANFTCQYALPDQKVYRYEVKINPFSVCNNGLNCKYSWEVTNGVILGGYGMNPSKHDGDGNYYIDVKWNNFNGSGKIKVTSAAPANAGVECSTCPAGKSITQDITIKYLGTPGNIKINNIAYAGSYQLACGKTPVTVSVPAVTNATNYVWSYPAGWTHSGSGNAITVTPGAGSGGVIKVVASRSDVPGLTTSSQLTITRPLPTTPTINSGPILLCAPKDITASASNATSYNWVSTGGITVSSPGNTNMAHLTGVSDGTVKVSAANSVCGVTSAYSTPVQVKRSAPLPGALLVTENGGGSPDFMCNGAGVSLNAYTSEPETKFSVWTTSHPANTIINSNGGTAYFNSYVNNCYGVDVTASNCFGSVKKGITICVDYCLEHAPVYEIYPNPANDFIYISFENNAENDPLPEMIKLFSEASTKEVKSVSAAEFVITDDLNNKKTIAITVSDLPRGTYYLQIVHDKTAGENVRIVLN
ncbi:T9SS type A sorting domain-containing protein [Dyadobacter sp. CY347]|uniref:T9SS type A sorting domain-containing protein n=1 Tax=Dyadobacter sp. CY347 TaxID=2909336 RepID=UPI001F305708|nr:T9SS type A sorting domain-containing protein [Dyadobacter sp. CY347]MCF2486896.1 T9SS type A sorting domain-containing protein [Dyadobacter sp. CY347]